MLRQWRSYGRGRARLVARYQALGLLPAESWRDAVATTGWLLLHAVDCLRGQARRACYLRVLAHVAGQVQGSREVGVLHVRRDDSHRDGEHSVGDVIAGSGLTGLGLAGHGLARAGLADTGPASGQPGDAQPG